MVCLLLVPYSASLAIMQNSSAERYNVIDHVFPSVGPHVDCGKTADWIRMPFGVVSGVGLGMGVLDFGGDGRRRRGSLGVNLQRPIITNGDFVASLC